jgi:hypothetical protein
MGYLYCMLYSLDAQQSEVCNAQIFIKSVVSVKPTQSMLSSRRLWLACFTLSIVIP